MLQSIMSKMKTTMTIKKTDLWQSAYNFLGVPVFISSDSPYFFSYTNSMYANFRKTFSRDCFLNFQVFIEGEHTPFVRVNGEEKYLNPQKDLIAQASFIVWSSIVDSMKDFYLIHAATLSYKGKGILILGTSGYGKTSLALNLAKKGCMLLSDSFAPISRKTWKMHPFPRTIGIREKIAESYSINNFLNMPSVKDFKDGGKRLLDPKLFKSKIYKNPSPVDYIFLLDSPLEEKRAKRSPFEYIDLAFFHNNKDVIGELIELEGVHISKKHMDGPLYAYRIGFKENKNTRLIIKNILNKFDDKIAYKKTETGYGTEESSPVVTEMSTDSMLVYFMMHFRNSPHGGSGGENFDGNLSRMAGHLCEMLGNVKSYRIENGGLEDVSNAITGIAD